MPAYARLEGGQELKAQLKRLEQDVAARIVVDAVNEAGEILLKETQRRAPVRRGVLRANLVLRRASKSRKSSLFRKGVARARVGYRRAASHAGPVEVGHKIKRKGRVVGHAPPHPFMRPAFDANVRRLAAELGRVLGRGIDAAVGRVP